ncbi:MAG: sulfite exporter TauE/SafE family protein [Elainellaceae cyanobacterium]
MGIDIGVDLTAAVMIWVATTMLLAVTVQSIVGFGSALISAPFLIGLLGIDVAIPLLSVLGITQQIILWMLYREGFNWQAMVRLTMASLVMVPVGILLVDYLPKHIVLTGLGLILIGYATYELAQLQLPKLASPRWGYLFGGAAGVLSGAYNIAGPPVILYANCRRWEPDEFKSNLQGYFLINAVILVVSRALQGQLTPNVWLLGLVALPAIAAGSLIGARLSRWIEPQQFRKAVLVLLIVLGIRLML